ncbi:EXS (ERD1/XPR1/SYG1) family protein [Pimephales promelas]|nr:EXS (ERD1/XPR1/SYG1) family protein [Pimephales promelas]
MAGVLTVCWCASVLASLHPPVLSIPQQLHPLLFHSLLLFLLLNPFSIFHAQARRWLMVTMCKVLAAPFQPVGFSECWLADQFNSLSPLFLGLRDLLCFYQINWTNMWSDSPPSVTLDCGQYSMAVTCLIQCFPPWLRFAQCLRCFWDTGHSLHLLNAGKYFTVFLMVTFAGLYNMARERSALLVEGRIYLYIWAVATCTGVVVTVSWDLRMDWGLLQGNGLLKDELVYSQQLYYYAAMLADVLLRVSWAINILLAQMKDSSAAATASALLAPLEVLRRCIWNLFRLENEQLKNCEKCCAVRDFWNIWRHLEKDQNVMYKDHKKITTHGTKCCLPFPNQRVKETKLPAGGTDAEIRPCI